MDVQRLPVEKLKYLDVISTLPNCPPPLYSNGARQAYRLVFEAKDHPDNFRPPAVIQPSRKWKNEDDQCDAFALSLYISMESLIAAMGALERTFKQLRKRMGDRIAAGEVVDTDGVMNEPEQDGHFNLHEFDACHLDQKFSWIGSLP